MAEKKKMYVVRYGEKILSMDASPEPVRAAYGALIKYFRYVNRSWVWDTDTCDWRIGLLEKADFSDGNSLILEHTTNY